MSLSLVVDLRLGLLIPQCVKYTKKSSHFRTSSSLNMAVRGTALNKSDLIQGGYIISL